MSGIYKVLRYGMIVLLALFVLAYPFAVLGMAFHVSAIASFSWAGSAMLFLEGTLLIVAAMLLYGWRRALLAALVVILGSYAVETLGVNSGWPFGSYHYLTTLQPLLPGGVPLPVMFAWVMVVFGCYGCCRPGKYAGRSAPWLRFLFAALPAVLLDLAIEPVAVYIAHYWQWLSPGPLAYYGVPAANFIAWLIVAWILLLAVASLFGYRDIQKIEGSIQQPSWSLRLAAAVPRLVFGSSLLMFGLIDLARGYIYAGPCILLAGILLYLLWRYA